MDYSPSGSSAHVIFQARILEWVVISYSGMGGLPDPGIKPVSLHWHVDSLPVAPPVSLSLWISPGISLEGMMLKLKLQYFGHLMRRVDSLEKTLMLGGIGGRRRRG